MCHPLYSIVHNKSRDYINGPRNLVRQNGIKLVPVKEIKYHNRK